MQEIKSEQHNPPEGTETTNVGAGPIKSLLITVGAAIFVAIITLTPIASVSSVYTEPAPLYALPLSGLVSIILLIEVLAVVVPALRPWRLGVAGRRRLWVIAVAIASIWQFIHSTTILGSVDKFVLNVSKGQFLAMQMVLFASQIAVAQIVTRWGLASGLVLVITTNSFCREVWFYVFSGAARANLSLEHLALQCFCVGATIAMTLWLFGVNLRRRLIQLPSTEPVDDEPRSDIYRTVEAPLLSESPPTRFFGLPSPGSGVFLLLAPDAIGTFLHTLTDLGFFMGSGAHHSGEVVAKPVILILVTLCVPLVVMLFYPQRAVLPLYEKLGIKSSDIVQEFSAARRQEMRRCTIFVALSLGLGWYCETTTGWSLSPALVVVCTAIVVDAIDWWRWRQRAVECLRVWSDHRPYAVPVILNALAEKNVEAFASAQRTRASLQAFGPYVPIEFFVPKKSKKRAEKVVKRVTTFTAE